jgi:hypothetical protein
VLNFPTSSLKMPREAKNLPEPRELTCIPGNTFSSASTVGPGEPNLASARHTRKAFLTINIQAVIDVATFEVAPTPTSTAGIDFWIKPVSFLIASLSLRTDFDYLRLHAL